MKSYLNGLCFCGFFICLLMFTGTVHAAHGISMDGALKYDKEFKQFDYTSASARKGGKLILHDLGSFDKMNPFTLKGNAPAGLGLLVFETLAVASLDEPFSKYGLIASDILLAEDRLSVTFTINSEAKFSNGEKVTVDDVQFSLNTIKSENAHPMYQSYFQDIKDSEIVSPSQIRFNFSQKNRELHLIACELPIFSKSFYEKNSFVDPSLTPPVGSGPYIVDKVDPGYTITYRRNPQYWAIDHPVKKGMYNFDTIIYKYFKDQIISVEAFKAGDFDFMFVNVAKQWARDMKGPKYDAQKIKKVYLEHKNNAGMQGFIFNTRKEIFKDPKVRQALGLAFDFEWANKSLFFGQYTRSNSFFSNSELAATGLPSGLELDFLSQYKEKLPKEVFTTPLTSVSTLPPNSLRKNLRRAKKLLNDAGWHIKDGSLVNSSFPGKELSFEVLLVSPFFERIMAPFVKNLEKIGVKASYRKVDPSLYTRRVKSFEYDMIVFSYGQSQSPGNEQRDFWHSSAADRKGSRNLIGIKNSVVDGLIDKIIYAANREELKAACKALDRVLWYEYYVIPNWYVPKHRVAYWNKFDRPEKLPLYYQPSQALMTWWIK